MPASYPRYPSRLEVIAYLEDYARALKRPPLFTHTATDIRRDGRRWVTEAGGKSFFSHTLVIAPATRACRCARTSPASPRSADRSSTRRPIGRARTIAASGCWSSASGNSAAEIAIDLVENGALPTVSVRGGVNVVPREVLGIPIASLGLSKACFRRRSPTSSMRPSSPSPSATSPGWVFGSCPMARWSRRANITRSRCWTSAPSPSSAPAGSPCGRASCGWCRARRS